MELRREKSKRHDKRRTSIDLFTDEPASETLNPQLAKTPVRANNRSEDEESPYFPFSTQEMREDVDVLWDYNSPQSRLRGTIVRKPRKQLVLQQSPKVPFRRHLSNNNEQIKQDFCKVREELMALRAEMAKPDHEESLILSPQEEESFKITSDDHLHAFSNIIEDHSVFESDCEDPFNDDMDEKLIFCTQQVEMELPTHNIEVNNRPLLYSGYKEPYHSNTLAPVMPKHQHIPKINCDTKSTNQNVSSLSNTNYTSQIPTGSIASNNPNQLKTTEEKLKKSLYDSEVFNDSFDSVLSQMNEDDFDQLTQVVDIKQYKNQDKVSNTGNNRSKVFPRSYSEEVQTNQVVLGSTGGMNKMKWHRTQSFESYNNAVTIREKQQEIEKRRLEAKAKLEAKKKLNCGIITTIPEHTDSTQKCSLEEIEKKRLEARAKLEAKKKQDIIEKNKQEALKRREENKKKNSQVKSSLSTRL